MAEFVMPALGADMESGTLVRWRRRPGDPIARGDVIAEVETDKGLIEVEVFVNGVVDRLLVEPGRKVPVGTPLALIREEAPAAAPPPAKRASPLARRRARELGVDLARLRGTGPDGAIRVEDVEQAAGKVAAAPAAAPVAPGVEVPEERAARMRRAIATAMARSKREIPHFYLGATIDLGPAVAWLAAENERRGVAERLLPGVLLLKATALALRQVPELNARWTEGGAPPLPEVHLGVAIALRGGGLVAPAIHDADRIAVTALMASLRDLVERARAGTLRSSELSDATVTVTSLGDRGAESVLPVIFLPQVAIVGFGRIVERPWVVGGAVVPRPVVQATLAADHRVSDGHRASRFLAVLDSLLRGPDKL